MNAPPSSVIERVRHHLVGLKMPRALETLNATLQRLERGELGALEAIAVLLAASEREVPV